MSDSRRGRPRNGNKRFPLESRRCGQFDAKKRAHQAVLGPQAPVKMFDRHTNLKDCQIITYKCDHTGKLMLLQGIAAKVRFFSVKNYASSSACRIIELSAQCSFVRKKNAKLDSCYKAKCHEMRRLFEKMHSNVKSFYSLSNAQLAFFVLF